MERHKAMKRLSISLLALVAAWPALAQDIALDEIVVTANRTETTRGRTGVSASVIDPSDLGAGRQTGIADAFTRLPGLSVSQQGPFGSAATLRIRGADQRYIAVFVDGVRVTDPTSTETKFDFGTLPAFAADRIEVLRGSQSALWGGSAVAGVVNITTARPTTEDTAQEIVVEAGTYATMNLGYTLTRRSGPLDTALTLSHLRTDGFSAAASGTEADGGEATRLSATLRYQLTDTLALGAAVFAQKTEADYDGFDADFVPIDADNRQERVETGARLFAELATGNTAHVFETTAFRIRRDYDQEDGPFDTDTVRDLSAFDGSRLTLGWQATTEVSPDLRLVYGIDTMTEKGRYTNLPSGTADTTIRGAFAQALWAVTPDLDVSATLRGDNHSSFGQFTTGRLALAWRPTQATTLRFAAATGFRAPSIDEMFGDYGSFVGNPNLTPEESQSFELGIERTFAGGASISATAFRLDIENLIRANGTSSSLENIMGQSVRQGVELAASLPLGERVNLGLAYTYTDARDPQGDRLALVAYNDLALSLTAEVGADLTAGVTVKHVTGRLDDFVTGPLPDYTVVGATVDYDLGAGRSAYLRVENLFGQEYQTSKGYAASGRALYVGLRASF